MQVSMSTRMDLQGVFANSKGQVSMEEKESVLNNLCKTLNNAFRLLKFLQ